MKAFRIFKTKYRDSWADGEGAFRFGGRWNTRGTRIIYAAESLSLAVLEMLVNLNNEEPLLTYSFAEVEFEKRSVLDIRDFVSLPRNWSDTPSPLAVQQIGDEWARLKVSAILKVPTAIIQNEFNYLINVEHPSFSKIKLGHPRSFHFDKRLRTNK